MNLESSGFKVSKSEPSGIFNSKDHNGDDNGNNSVAESF